MLSAFRSTARSNSETLRRSKRIDGRPLPRKARPRRPPPAAPGFRVQELPAVSSVHHPPRPRPVPAPARCNVVLPRQSILEQAEPPVDVPLDRADRRPQDRRDLPIGDALDVAEDHGGPVPWWERAHEGRERAPEFCEIE